MTGIGGPTRVRYPHTRWNFVVIIIDAGFFVASLAFIDPGTVLPVLLRHLNASVLLIGLMGAIQRAGWLVPQLLVTSFVLHRERKYPFVLWPVVVSRLPLVALAAGFSSKWGAERPEALLFLTVAVFGLFFFGDGLVGVPWQDICARTIPPTLRGRFFGGINLVGGLLGLGTGELVKRILADPAIPFPYNYGQLFIFLCVGMVVSAVFVALIKEPRRGPTAEARSLPGIVRAIPAMLREHVHLRRLIVCQILLGVPLMAMPFYAVYATAAEGLDLPAAVLGWFVQAAVVGSAAASMFWAYISDRVGSVRVLRGVSWAVFGVPVSALLVPTLARALGAEHAMAYFYAIVFLLSGTTWSGTWIGFTNHVLEIAPDDIRPLFLGLQATLSSPAIMMPFIGGWLLGYVSFETLFAIAAVGGAVAVVYVRRLQEPRDMSSAGGEIQGVEGPPEESSSSGDGEV